MFLYMFLLVLGVCAAQQDVLGSTQSLPVSNGQYMQLSFVSNISHAWATGSFYVAAYMTQTIRHVLVHNSKRTGNPLLTYDVYPKNLAYVDKDNRDRRFLRSSRLRSRPAQIYQLAHSQPMLSDNTPAKLRKASQGREAVNNDWRLEHVLEPDVSDKETVVSLAKMSSDAYLLDERAPDWLRLNSSAGFNLSSGFGWLDNRLRGHVFADAENRTVVIAIKGTSSG